MEWLVTTVNRKVEAQVLGYKKIKMNIRGQTGALQGISQALYEETVYSQEGILITSNFSDYVIPTAVESIKVEWKPLELTKSDTPIGSKGIGELPTIAATPTILNAVEDAIGKNIYTMPIKPELILKLLSSQTS